MSNVTLIKGDGIGPEVVNGAIRVLEAAGAAIDWDEQVAGVTAVERGLETLPVVTLDSFRENKICLKGPLTTPVGSGFRSVNVALRKEFDLYANIRPAKSLVPGGRYDNVDLVVIRENTEGLYAGIEHYIDTKRSAAESITIVTQDASRRVIQFAFEYVAQRPKQRLTLVHKANILKYTSGLFLDVGKELASDHPEIEFNDRIIDNMAMQLVLDPQQFDTIVTTNMFGDILSDLCAGLVGGLGMAPAANVGQEMAMFEAVHGSAPDIAGEGVANPTALILAAALLCDQIDQAVVGDRTRAGVERVLLEGQVRTPDLGGTATTDEFCDAVVESEERMTRDTVRRFVDEQVMPIIEEAYLEGRFPQELIAGLGELGVLGANLPEEYGCAGMNNVAYGLIMQELERGDSGVRSFASVQGALVMYPIFTFGSEEQKRRWLPVMATGEAIGCFGLTEADFGSNPLGMATRAEPDGDGWVLNGSKMWITNGSMAHVAVVWAKTSDGIRGFLVERGTDGFDTVETHGKHSLRASDTSELVFNDVRLDGDALLPGSGGLKSPLMCLTQARYGIAWGAVGSAMACYGAGSVRPPDRGLPAHAGEARRDARSSDARPAARVPFGATKGRR